MTANGRTIRDYPLPKASVAIRYSIEFEEQEARIFAGMSLQEFNRMPGTPEWCDDMNPLSKADVVVLYRMHGLIGAVQEHAAATKGRR